MDTKAQLLDLKARQIFTQTLLDSANADPHANAKQKKKLEKELSDLLRQIDKLEKKK
jgi:hypothetical protein